MTIRHRRSWAAAVSTCTLIALNSYLLAGDPPLGVGLRVTLSAASLVLGLAGLLVGLRQARRCHPA